MNFVLLLLGFGHPTHDTDRQGYRDRYNAIHCKLHQLCSTYDELDTIIESLHCKQNWKVVERITPPNGGLF